MTEPYRIRSPETWAQARDDYVAGLNAEAVCRRHDLGLSAFRRRARKYGWRRVDQDDPSPTDPDFSIYGDINGDEQIEIARLRFIHALEHGKSTEALRWRRLWYELRDERDTLDADLFPGMSRREIIALLAADTPDDEHPDEAVALSSPVRESPSSAPATLENVHDVHSIFSGVHILETDRPSKRAARRLRGREGRPPGGP
ncbi:hypothetical protein [Brevundimonas sp. GCM10030266]|uniref:hypothetical protein n=1 Tax=Brevundimonas sp. GCM10030266 TaxID=3273386 RepID=UPI003613ECFF